jgi:hypothetical protein
MRSIITLLSLITLTSCNMLIDYMEDSQKNEYHPMPAEKRSSMKEGSVLVYEDTGGVTDTLFCVLKMEAEGRQALGGTDMKDPSAYWEFEAIFLTVSPDTNYLKEIDFRYNQLYLLDYIKDSCHPYYYFDATYYRLPLSDKCITVTIGDNYDPITKVRDFDPYVFWYNVWHYKQSDVTDSMEVKNKYYYEVFGFTPDDTITTELKKIYINKDFGIIKYELKDGNVWSLNFNISLYE